MSLATRELDRAGISDARERAGFIAARRLNSRHGRTYYLATLLLPPERRPYVHALYGFARYADDVVDLPQTSADTSEFTVWGQRVLRELEWGASSDPLICAVIATRRRFGIPVAYFGEFLESMRMDLSTSRYASFDELRGYMWGSAAVIGLQMLPILGRRSPSISWSELEPFAIALGYAFQLTNFIRDVGEDLDRGRIYLPADSMAEHGVDEARLARQVADQPVRNLIAAEVDRARAQYALARPGLDLVERQARACVQTAFTLYGAILDEIERADYDVFTVRASVPLTRRLRVALPAAIRARARPRHPA